MITGFNTNHRYRGRMFHVQTEDSGRNNPHIISHLYFQGTILASEKRGYDEHLGSEQLDDEVRALMEAQHKAMLKRLKKGEFDAVIAERLEGDAAPGTENGEGSTTSPSMQDAPTPQPEVVPATTVVAAASEEARERAFGDGIVSQKPLDEVILEYLVQKARDRGGAAGRPAERGARRSRSKR